MHYKWCTALVMVHVQIPISMGNRSRKAGLRLTGCAKKPLLKRDQGL